MALTYKCFQLIVFFLAGYPAAQSSTQSYSQSTQGYGASGYDTAPAAATPAASQSYGSQSAYTAQTAYPGYGQQAAPTAPQAYVSTYSSSVCFCCWNHKLHLVSYLISCKLMFFHCLHQLQRQQPAIQLQSE